MENCQSFKKKICKIARQSSKITNWWYKLLVCQKKT